MEQVAETFSELEQSIGLQLGTITISNFLPAIIFLIVALLVIKIIMKIVKKAVSQLKVEKSLHTFIKSTTSILLYSITIIIVLGIIGVPITSLVAVLSIAGLAVSLAVQGSLSNLAGGITILATKPFKVNDFVEACGVSGTIMDIGLFYTKLCTTDKKDIFIPNGKISGDTIINYSSEANRKLVLKFSASYDDEIEKVKSALLEAINNDSRILSDPKPFVNVSAYLDSSIEYMAAIWVKNEEYWDVNFAFTEAVKHYFDKNGITMSYNHVNVHMLDK